MEPFVYAPMPTRVIFERGGRTVVAREVERLGCQKPVVVCTSGQKSHAMEVYALLGESAVGVIDSAIMHTPVEVTERALKQVGELGADCTVAVGGGSAIGLAKAIALRAGIPQISVPTTYAGSEMTAVVGQTADGVKTTQKDIRVLPATVIYDVDFSLNLPVDISATSGMNAIAHAVEALYAQERNPITTLHCLDAIRALNESLRIIVNDPTDIPARQQAMYGAFLCGMALGTVGMSLHHKLCHTLGGSFNLPHAPTHSVVLPHATTFNTPGAGGALDPLCEILGASSPGAGLWDLAKAIGVPLSLQAIGMKENQLDEAAKIATANPYWNPRKFDYDDIRHLLGAAYAGERPPD